MYKYIILMLFSLLLPHMGHAALRDPTRPATLLQKKVGNVTQETLRLDAILISPDRQIAVINGQYLSMGDEIAGNHIVDIQPDTVQLDGPSGRIILLLFGKPIKQEATGSK